MLNFARTLHLGVAADSLVLARTRRWGSTAFEVLAESPLTPDQPLSDALHLLAAGQRMTGQRLQVVLDVAHTRLWSVKAPQGAARLADLQAACAMRFQSLFGESLQGWQLAADWQARGSFMAAAVRADLAGALEDFAVSSGCVLTRIDAALLAAWNRWCAKLAPDAWFAWVHGGWLNLAVCGDGRLLAWRSLACPADASAAWLQQQVAREALRLECPAPALLQACGAVPQAWIDDAGGTLRCMPLDGGRRGSAPLSPAAQLVYAGVAA